MSTDDVSISFFWTHSKREVKAMSGMRLRQIMVMMCPRKKKDLESKFKKGKKRSKDAGMARG